MSTVPRFGDVTIIRPDGTVEVVPPYNREELERIHARSLYRRHRLPPDGEKKARESRSRGGRNAARASKGRKAGR